MLCAPLRRAREDGRTDWRRPRRDRRARDRFITAARRQRPRRQPRPNASSASPGSTRGGIEPHRRARRVVRRQHARRQRLAAVASASARRLRSVRPSTRLDVGARRAAGRSSIGVVEAADDGRSRRRPRPAPPSTIRSIRPARSLCTWAPWSARRDRRHWRDGATTRPAEAAQDVARHRMRWDPDRDGVERPRWRDRRPGNRRSSAAPASAGRARTPRPALAARIEPGDLRARPRDRRHGRSAD